MDSLFHLDPIAILATIAFLIFLLMARFATGTTRTLGFVLAGIVALLIGLGVIKGFARWHYGWLNVNTGKLIIALGLAILLPSPLKWSRICWLWLLLALIVLPILAVVLGFAHLHPHVGTAVLLFALNNYVSVVAEDFFFRRFVQDHLQGLGTPIEVLITAALFGAVHLPSGTMFALLAFIAGIFYSATYRASGNSVWAVTGVHSAVNITRAILFGIP